MVKNRLYVIASYRNKSILGNIYSDWSNDLRVKIFGNKNKFIKNKILLKHLVINSELLYSGEYYHLYNSIKRKDAVLDENEIREALEYEFEVIKNSDIVVVVIDNEFNYYSVIKLFNAVISNKEITIFIDSKDVVTYKKWFYFMQVCKLLNNNIVIIDNTISNDKVIEYIRKIKKSIIHQPLAMSYSANKILEETRLFVSGNFDVGGKKNINKENIGKLLKNDIRIKIIVGSDKNLIECLNINIMNKRYLKYNGSFYYYIDTNNINDNEVVFYKDIPKSVMKRIATSDIFICILTIKDQLDTIIELLYAAFLGKDIYLFYDENIIGNEVSNSYRLVVLFVKMLGSKITLYDTVMDKNILNFVSKLG